MVSSWCQYVGYILSDFWSCIQDYLLTNFGFGDRILMRLNFDLSHFPSEEVVGESFETLQGLPDDVVPLVLVLDLPLAPDGRHDSRGDDHQGHQGPKLLHAGVRSEYRFKKSFFFLVRTGTRTFLK